MIKQESKHSANKKTVHMAAEFYLAAVQGRLNEKLPGNNTLYAHAMASVHVQIDWAPVAAPLYVLMGQFNPLVYPPKSAHVENLGQRIADFGSRHSDEVSETVREAMRHWKALQ